MTDRMWADKGEGGVRVGSEMLGWMSFKEAEQVREGKDGSVAHILDQEVWGTVVQDRNAEMHVQIQGGHGRARETELGVLRLWFLK